MLYVFDSDHLSLHQRGHQAIGKRLKVTTLGQIHVTIISAEELLRGRLAQIRRAKKAQEHINAYYWLAKTLEYLNHFPILSYESRAESHFQNLRKQGLRVGTQDLKIAAIALSQRATLVTRNTREFEAIPSLSIEDWSI